MNAWDLVSHDGPLKGFVMTQHPDPKPGPQQVLIAVEGFGLNYADIMAARGHYANNPDQFGRNYGAVMLGRENSDFFI